MQVGDKVVTSEGTGFVVAMFGRSAAVDVDHADGNRRVVFSLTELTLVS